MQPKNPSDVSRREVIKGLAALGALPAVAGLSLAAESRQADLIRKENAKPGTRDWMLAKTRIDPATKYRCPWVEGYCSHASAKAGDTIQLFVSTNPAAPVRIDLYRTGYYGGDGGRLVAELGTFEAIT